MAAEYAVKYADVTERSGWCDNHLFSHVVTIRVYLIDLEGVRFLGESKRCMT